MQKFMKILLKFGSAGPHFRQERPKHGSRAFALLRPALSRDSDDERQEVRPRERQFLLQEELHEL